MSSLLIALLLSLLIVISVIALVILIALNRNMRSADTVNEDTLNAKLNDQMDRMTNALTSGLSSQAKSTTELLTNMNQELGKITVAQQNITDLSTNVENLSGLLGNSQDRGKYGEVQLNSIITDALPRDLYEFQATLQPDDDRTSRVDCLLKLPEPTGNLPVDSKFPITGFQEMSDPSLGADERNKAQKEFENAVIQYLKDIESKYVIPELTCGVALMFIASEKIVSEIYSNMSRAIEESNKLKVYIVGPSNLMLAVATVRSMYYDAYVAKQADAIKKALAKLGGDMGRLDKRVESLRRHFNSAQKDIDQITTSKDKVLKGIDSVVAAQLPAQSGSDN